MAALKVFFLVRTTNLLDAFGVSPAHKNRESFELRLLARACARADAGFRRKRISRCPHARSSFYARLRRTKIAMVRASSWHAPLIHGKTTRLHRKATGTALTRSSAGSHGSAPDSTRRKDAGYFAPNDVAFTPSSAMAVSSSTSGVCSVTTLRPRGKSSASQ